MRLSGDEAADGLSVAYEYEPHRNVRTHIANEFNQSPISSFDYAYDAIGRRTRRIDGAATTPSRTNLFGYNLRSELVDAALGSNYFGYAYDPIGNRISAEFNTNMISYVASELNQYTQISNLQSQIVPIYDVDGNMTSYNGWTFSWDAENRLVTASNQGTVVKNAYDYMSRRIQKTVSVWDVDHWSPLADRSFLYDGWNMISETISGAGLPSGRTNHYVWGLDLSGTLQSHVSRASGITWQGAGGIGGLLSATRSGPTSPSTVFYACDANGNITDLTDSNGAVVAHYEYDPYGNTLLAEGAEASINPYRFSSKYADEETALYYYGFRFYSPEMGRWGSRDPVSDESFLRFQLTNLERKERRKIGKQLRGAALKPLYEYVENQPISEIDPLGLDNPGAGGQNNVYCVTWPPEDRGPTMADCVSQVMQGLSTYQPPPGDIGTHSTHCVAACLIARNCPGGKSTARNAQSCWEAVNSGLPSDTERDDAGANKGIEYSDEKESCQDLCSEGFQDGEY